MLAFSFVPHAYRFITSFSLFYLWSALYPTHTHSIVSHRQKPLERGEELSHKINGCLCKCYIYTLLLKSNHQK